ncbi:MAG: glycoside hydrolase family 95 protein, partial [Pedobacter sp.]
GKGITGNPALNNYDDKLWKTIQVPSYEGWETVGLSNVDGAVWFRTTFNVPLNLAGKDLILDLNRIRDQDFTYVNGVLVGNNDNTEARKYTIPAKLIKAGTNTIAIQVLNYYDKGGIAGFKDTKRHIGIYPVGSSVENGVSLVKKWKYKIQNTNPPATAQYQASYQPFGDLNLYFKLNKSAISNYKRTLDLSTAISTTAYTQSGIDYKRAYFASAPNQAVVINLSASKPKSISFDAQLSSVHQNSTVKIIDKNTISLSVQVKDGALKGESRLTAIVKNGTLKTINQKLSISNADEVTLYLTAGTNFISADDVSGNPNLANNKALTSLKGKSYPQIKQDHIKEYQSYYNTLDVNFGVSEHAKLPTDERLVKFANANDPAF